MITILGIVFTVLNKTTALILKFTTMSIKIQGKLLDLRQMLIDKKDSSNL